MIRDKRRKRCVSSRSLPEACCKPFRDEVPCKLPAAARKLLLCLNHTTNDLRSALPVARKAFYCEALDLPAPARNVYLSVCGYAFVVACARVASLPLPFWSCIAVGVGVVSASCYCFCYLRTCT